MIAGLLVMAGVIAVFVWLSGPCGLWREDRLMKSAKDGQIGELIGKEVAAAKKSLDPERMRATMADLEGMGERSSWESQWAASEYLLERLKAMGLRPQIREYLHDGRNYRNIAVSFEGRTDRDAILMAVAHYDSKNWVKGGPCPGADDNATGVSALLEIARVLPQIPRQRTWQIVFFSNEETGRLGSRDFVRKARLKKKEIAGVIAVDVVGYRPPGVSEIIGLAGSSLPAERKVKGAAKVFLNAYHAVRTGGKSLKMAFRSEELFLAPAPSIRESIGAALFWELGGACP